MLYPEEPGCFALERLDLRTEDILAGSEHSKSCLAKRMPQGVEFRREVEWRDSVCLGVHVVLQLVS